MLVLTRKRRESVVVGGGRGFDHRLKITVLDFENGKVLLGFDLDSAVPIHRAEVWERIHGSDGHALAGPITNKTSVSQSPTLSLFMPAEV